MYKIRLTAKSKRELKNLSKQDKIRVGEIIQDLKEDALIGKSLSRNLIKKFSYRVGVYRIIYLVDKEDKVVTILSARHRGVVYS